MEKEIIDAKIETLKMAIQHIRDEVNFLQHQDGLETCSDAYYTIHSMDMFLVNKLEELKVELLNIETK